MIIPTDAMHRSWLPCTKYAFKRNFLYVFPSHNLEQASLYEVVCVGVSYMVNLQLFPGDLRLQGFIPSLPGCLPPILTAALVECGVLALTVLVWNDSTTVYRNLCGLSL